MALTHLSIPTELVDQIVSEVVASGRRDDVDTVTFALYKEDHLVFLRHIISLYSWLAPFVHEVTLKFTKWADGKAQIPGQYLMPVLDALPQLAPQLQTVIFDEAHSDAWSCRAMSRYLRSLPPVATLKLQHCRLRIMDIKMFLRGFPNLQHLDITGSLLSGDSKLALTAADVSSLSSLRLKVWGTNSSTGSLSLPPKVIKLLTSSIVMNGVSCLSLGTQTTSGDVWDGVLGALLRAAGPSLKCLKWVDEIPSITLETYLQEGAIDLSSNVRLHTLVIANMTSSYRTVDGTQLARVLNKAERDAALQSYAALLSQPRFHSLAEIYFVIGWVRIRGRPPTAVEQINEAVRNVFATFVVKGVVVKAVVQKIARVISDEWEQETIAEGK
ncbi:hypothetical protein EIP91_003296 [Steccherinum ochraceum]|uniref:F-box domain-containing protein n=1 Tax=Steccherinum ochraceum TaxID=92696 RepID=A0A4R0RMI8_9APHY|nr:hypothetical protein EIP91_003296 [Steccherinum ochraceum]